MCVSIANYFIIPEAIITVGIVLVAILSMQKQKIADSKGDISIGSLNKAEILKLSQEEIKKLRKVVATAAGCLFLITLLIAFGAIFLCELSLVSIVTCLVLQVLLTVICGIPFMKRIRAFRHVS